MILLELCDVCGDSFSNCKCNQSDLNKQNYKEGKTPSYYIGKYKGIKAIDVVFDFELQHCKASALEYILRSGKKDDEKQDIQKAINHLQMYLDHLNNDI